MQSPTRNELKPSLLRRVREQLYPLASKLMAKSTLVEGELKGSALPCRLLFVHNCLYSAELRKRSFDGTPRVIREKTVFLPTLGRLLRATRSDYDICIAVVPNSYAGSIRAVSAFEGHEEVRQIIDTSPGWEEMRRRFSTKKRQIANNFEEKNGLSYRISHEQADFDHFYDRMYAPLIRRRYGALADIDSYDKAKAWFDKGFVIFVTKHNDPVAGALAELQGGRLLFRRSGVLDGDESHVKAGVQTALYYFQLRYALDHKLNALDTLKSTPILNDGVFRHKADWGATTLPDDEAQRRVFYIFGQPSACQAAFFEINPIVVEAAQGLGALVGRRLDASADAGKGGRADSRALLVRGVERVVEIRWPPEPVTV